MWGAGKWKWGRQLTEFIFIPIWSISLPHRQSLSGGSASDWQGGGHPERPLRTCGQDLPVVLMLSRSRVQSVWPAEPLSWGAPNSDRSRGLSWKAIGLCTDGKRLKKKKRRSDLTGSENGSGKGSAQAKLTEPGAAKWKKMKGFLQPSGGLVSWIHPRKESEE